MHAGRGASCAVGHSDPSGFRASGGAFPEEGPGAFPPPRGRAGAPPPPPGRGREEEPVPRPMFGDEEEDSMQRHPLAPLPARAGRALSAFVLLLASACAMNPVSGRPELTLVSE